MSLPIGSRGLLVAVVAVQALLSGCGQEEAGRDAGLAAVPVTTATVERRDVDSRLFAVGRLVSRNAPVLASEVDARVTRILVDEGEAVRRGQVLLLQDGTPFELAAREARAAIEGLDVSIANELRRVQRYRDLEQTNALSQERLDDAEAKLAADRAARAAAEARLAIAEDRLARAELVSPIDGVIQRRHVSVGDFTRTASPLMTVTDTTALRAELPFPETVAHRLRPGQRVLLESAVAPGLKHEAVVDRVRPQVAVGNQALVVIIEVENPGPWRPGATVEAAVITDARPGALLVPYGSVVERPAGSVVYVLDDPGGGIVRERVVEPGERQNGVIEIRSGLEAGEVVAADGASFLSDGALVAVRGGS
jgi:RND family efflux transporter MFP subunit